MADWAIKTCPCGKSFSTRMPSREHCDSCVMFYNAHKYYPVTTQLADGTEIYHHATEKINE